MSWLAITICVYLGVAYLGLAAAVVLCSDDDQWRENLWETAKQKERFAAVAYAGAISAAFLLIGPFVPLLFIATVWQEYQSSRFWKRFSRVHRPALMETIAFNQMDESGRACVNEVGERAESLGFESVNSFLLKPEPLLIEVQAYLSPDRQSVLCVGHCNRDRFYSLTTLLSNRLAIETSVDDIAKNMEKDVDEVNATGSFCCEHFDWDDADLAIIYQRHCDLIGEQCQLLGCETMPIEREHVRATLRFSNHRFGQAMHALGNVDVLPPSPPWPFSDAAPPTPIAPVDPHGSGEQPPLTV